MSVIAATVETDIPARLDRLPWTRFYTLIAAALGITWILDGLEVTLAGSIAGEWQGAVDVASILLRARLVPTPDLAVSGGIPAFSRSERAHGEFDNQPRRCAAQGEESLRPDRPTLAPKQKDLHPQMK